MKVVSTRQMRDLDRRTIENYGVPGEELMDRAGLGVANVVDRLFDRCEMRVPSVMLVAGRGNNGGDAFAAARYLHDYGCDVTVLLAGSADEISGDARTHMNRMRQSKVALEELATREDWDMAMAGRLDSQWDAVDAVVDGVLGTGIKGPSRGPAAGAIGYINMLAENAIVVAIDVPSGLDSDTGKADGDVVSADITVTMGLPKQGLIEPSAADRVGRIEVVDIGIPRELTDQAKSDLEFIADSDLMALFPRRARDSHKGNYGHLLMLGGASGYSGAMALAAMAAARSGAGLVTAVVPGSLVSVVAAAVPEVMVYGADETERGSLAASCWPAWRDRLDEFSAVVVGPGMTRHDEITSLVSMILRDCGVPLVMDADALNVFEGRAGALRTERRSGVPLIITPHPGEMGRLMGCSSGEVQADRFKAARVVSEETGAVVVLKGAGTLVAQHGRPLHINMTGNPGMARGGMGDALSGLLAGLVAQGISPFDAACAAVFLHGRAGDEAAVTSTENCITVRDVINSIPLAFKRLSRR